jgi:hypothetical protein
MTLVNKHLGSVAQAFLYQDIEMAWVENSPPPIKLVVRTLLDRPALASMVRSIYLDGHGVYNCFRWDVEVSSFPILDRTRVRHVIGQTEKTTEWANQIARGTLGAIVAFLIALIPNVQKVFRGPDFSINVEWITLLFSLKGASDIPTFGSLTKFAVSHLDVSRRRHGFDVQSCCLGLFRLPQLKEISIITYPRRILPWHSLPSPLVMEHLKGLSLCARSDQGLETVLALSPNLTKLKWMYAKDTGTPIGRYISLNTLGASLQPLRYGLRELVLYVNETLDNDIEINHLAGLLSLQDLVALRSLTIPFCFLQGMSSRTMRPLECILPSSLVSLTLSAELGCRDDYEWASEQVMGLIVRFLDSQRHSAAGLRNLILAGDIWPYYRHGAVESTEKIKELQRCASRAGIELRAQHETAFEREEGQALDNRMARYGYWQ